MDDTGKTWKEVEADILDLLLTERGGWVKIENGMLSVNVDIPLDPRQEKVARALIEGTAPSLRKQAR
jgi:hypothetical protein